MDVVELQAGEFGLVSVRLGVEPAAEQIDDLHPALLARARLEQLLLAGADRTLLHRALDDRQALGDLLWVRGGAVPAEEELADIGGNGILASELLSQVLANEIALEDISGEPVELVNA